MSGTTPIFERDLPKSAANFVPLSPVGFLKRAARVFRDRTAVIHGDQRHTYGELHERCVRLASALAQRGIGHGDTVAVMCPNIPAMLEAHFAVPMLGAVLNTINTRLDADTVAFILDHGEAKAVLSERSLNHVMGEALARATRHAPVVVDVLDRLEPDGASVSDLDYEDLLNLGDPAFIPAPLPDEWDAIALNYTSGTTGNPKGVVYHHRGAYLNALSNALTFGLNARSVYLWTLPMFHCNGWCYPWAVTAVGGTHVCLRKIDPALVFRLIRDHGVTHMCGAPVVLNTLVNAPAEQRTAFPQQVQIATGGAAPPSAIIAKMEEMGFLVTHLYGMTECYGPSTSCEWQAGWDGLQLEERAARMARQGVAMVAVDDYAVKTPETFDDVPADGRTIGMLMIRSNTVMKGYLKNTPATAEAFANGWLNTGDLTVMHPDNYVEIKDRAKDIIISGGENISSLEIEEVLYKHPAVLEAAVVAHPDPTWGETPHAFVTLHPDAAQTIAAEDLMAWCRARTAHYKCPRYVTFGPLPKTSTGKIQKHELRRQVGFQSLSGE